MNGRIFGVSVIITVLWPCDELKRKKKKKMKYSTNKLKTRLFMKKNLNKVTYKTNKV